MKKKFTRSPTSIYNLARSILVFLAGITVVNCILSLLGSEDFYVDSILLAYWLFSQETLLGILLAALIVGAYVACWLLSKRKSQWMIVALALFSVDMLFLLILIYAAADYYGFGFALLLYALSLLIHIAILVLLILAVKHRKAGTMTDEEIIRSNTAAGATAARIEGRSDAPLAPEIDCGVYVKEPGKKLAMPSQGQLRFEDNQLVVGGQGAAAQMLVGSMFAPMKELARVGYHEIVSVSIPNPKKRDVNIQLPDGRVLMLTVGRKSDMERFRNLMAQHGIQLPPAN